MKTLRKLVFTGVIVFALFQLIRPNIPEAPATAEWQAPPAVKHVFEKNCYSCHSNEKRLAWFDEMAPAYWLVRYDILTARKHLNFSTLGSQPPAAQKATLYEAVNMIQLGAMPLRRFRLLHPEARVTPEELATLKTYLAPWTSLPDFSPSRAAASSRELLMPASLTEVHPEWNGVAFDPSFATWQPLSTTDRGDNNTFRWILGNDIAVEAVRSGHLRPWPDGTGLAKIAWQQETGADGLRHPGKFVQVELMQKDARRYRNTQGWGWGRWRGLDLKPYGKDASFVGECTGCHQPMRPNDYVYTLPITAAQVSGTEVVNSAATLPAHLPYEPLNWRAITMYVDPAKGNMATLYGNEIALQAAHAYLKVSSAGKKPVYPAGAVLALVTWSQREDPHWFGGRMPNRPQSVEFVEVASLEETSRYRQYAGPSLTENNGNTKVAAERTSFIVELSPAQLP